jgi:hypothetical protein
MTEIPVGRVRLAHIAVAADVSVPTVSKVPNDVEAETRSRVAALLADYNYTVRRRPGRRTSGPGSGRGGPGCWPPRENGPGWRCTKKRAPTGSLTW